MELSILNLLVVLAVAWSAGRVASRFGYPSVLGELLAGILFGPPLLGLLKGSEALSVLAEVGIILMMVYIGMEIDPRELGKASRAGLLAAIGGFVTPFVLAYFAVIWFGGTPIAAVFVGVAAGVTSLATKSRILVDLQLLDTRIAHVMMAGALIADTVSLVIFAGLLGVAESSDFNAISLLVVAGKAIAFFLVAGLVGQFLLPRLGRWLRPSGGIGRTSTFMLVLIIALAFAEMAHLAGMHGILGAFVAGLFLRERIFGRDYAHEMMSVVRDASIGFLAPVFFVTAGFAVSLDVFSTDLALLVVVVVFATVGKILGTAIFYLPTGNGWREGVTIGAGMNGRGAVEIIIAQIGFSLGLISAEIFSILVFMAIFTTATVPIFLKLGTDWLRRRGELVRSEVERTGTIIVGAGPLARQVAQILSDGGPVTIVDSNAAQCDDARELGLGAVCGSALEEHTLSEAGTADARTFIALTPNAQVNILAARTARAIFKVPDVHAAPEDRASLTHLGATALFAGSVDLTDWDYRVEHGLFDVLRMPVDTSSSATAIYQALAPVALPVALVRDGTMMTFHEGLVVEAGDEVVLLEATLQPEPASDRFDELIRSAPVLELDGPYDSPTVFGSISEALGPIVGVDSGTILDGMNERERLGTTVVLPGVAIPHVITPGEGQFGIVLARVPASAADVATTESTQSDASTVRAVFAMASSTDERAFHLRALSAIAFVVQSPGFLASWQSAKTDRELRDVLLRADRSRFQPTNAPT